MDDFTPETPTLPHFNTKHGHARRKAVSKEYRAWRDAINRCLRPQTRGYENYGGRGVTVCDRWLHGEDGESGFECFLADVGHAPSPGHTIDRENSNGNYEPGNCRWILRAEQNRNKRSNRWISGFGKTQLMEDWAKEFSINPATIYDRVVLRGMTIEEAVVPKSYGGKLRPEQVPVIRSAYVSGEGSYLQLARRFGVSKSMIGAIVRGDWWKNA